MSPQTSLQTTEPPAAAEPAVTVEVQPSFLDRRFLASVFRVADGGKFRQCVGSANAPDRDRAVELAREAAASRCPALAKEIAAAPATGMPPPAR